jgi:hypothetical protein
MWVWSFSAQNHIMIGFRIDLIDGELFLGNGMRFLVKIFEIEALSVSGREEIEHHAGYEDEADGDERIDDGYFSACLHRYR